MKLITIALVSVALYAHAEDNSALCQQDNLRQITFTNKATVRNANEITILSWNAHKLADKKYFFDLKKLSETTDIMMVQEAIHTTAWQNAFASHMPFAFSFNKSFCWNDTANGVLTASRFGLANNVALVSPGVEPGSFTPKVSGYSQVKIGNTWVHIMNTHALNFNVGISFENQIDQLVNFLKQVQGPIIWAGDFNTWNPLRMNYLNEQAKALGLVHLTPKNDSRTLKLDHIYVRGFLVTSTEILDNKTSDHQPVQAILKLAR